MKVAILSGSVYGTADTVAERASQLLEAAGFTTFCQQVATLDELLAFEPQALLTVVSTTGMGELPDRLMPLYQEIRERCPDWKGLPGAVLALGNSCYDTFCGAGELIRELYAELGVRESVPMLRLDSCETMTPEVDAEPWVQSLIEQWRA